MTNTALLKTFLREETVKGRRPQGITDLRTGIPKFFVYLETTGLELLTLSIPEAQDYQGWLLETGRKDGQRYSTKTITSYLVAVTAFYEFLKRKQLVLENPFKHIRKLKVEKSLPRNLPREHDLDQVLEGLSHFEMKRDMKEKIKAYKVHVLCELLYSTGMRIDEAANLKADDIDFDRGMVTIREGKGGFTRMTFLNEYAGAVLKIYVQRILPLLKTRQNAHRETIFLTNSTNLGKACNQGLKAACEPLDVPKITSHTFRHCVGYHLTRAGCSLRWIQQILGHRKLRNTEIYTKIDHEDLRNVIDTYHPRKWTHGETE